MPSINDRIGSQNVIRVLSNASAAPTRIINLTDVESTLKTRDGMLLVWNLEDEKFYMTDTIDSSSLIATGIVTFSNTTQSSSTTTGAVIVSGGVGIAKNLNVGGNANIVGVVTFGTGAIVVDGTNNIITVGSGVTISSSDGITAPSINVLGPLTAQSLSISGVSTLASAGGITTTGGSLFVNNNLTIGQNLKVDGTSEFIGVATFRGGTINLGDANSDDINVGGEFISDLNPNDDASYDLGIDGKRWRTGRFSGLVTTTDLFVSGLSTFLGSVNIDGPIDISGDVEIDNLNVSGLSTFGSNVDINASVDISSNLVVNNNFQSVGVTTLASAGGITTTGGELYVDTDLTVGRNLKVDGNSEIVGVSTFTGNQFTTGNVSITGFVTVTEGLYYDVGDFDGPNGVSYFDDSGKLIGAASTESGISTSNYVLTTNASGTPVWTSTIDGGEY